MKNIISFIRQTLVVITITAISVSTSYAGNLFSTVDKNIVGPNQTVKLTVHYDEEVNFSELELKSLNDDFKVLSVSPNSSFFSSRSSNGKSTRKISTTWDIVLATKRQGKLTIPSFSVNGDLSQEITIESNFHAASDTNDQLKIKISADNHSVHESEQVIITAEIQAQRDLESLRLQPLDTDIELKELGSETTQRIDNGIIYDITISKHIFFPTKAGKLKFPSTAITAIKGAERGRFGETIGGEQIIARSDAFEIDVKPLDNTHSPWFPAKEVIIKSEWSGNTSAVIAGEPITRSLTVSVLGKEASSIPPLNIPTSADYKSYKDKPTTNDKRIHQGFVGERIESEAIVFSSPGTFTLPEVRVKWWDAKSDEWKEAFTPEEKITVLPNSSITSKPDNIIVPPENTAVAANSTAVEASYRTHWLWPLVSGLLFTLCLIQAFFIWKLKSPDNPKEAYSSPHKNLSEKNAWLHLQQVIKNNDLIETRQALHDWAQTLSSNHKQQSINELTNYLNDDEAKLKLSNTITQLESCLYKEETSFSNSALNEQLLELRKHLQSNYPPSKNAETLAPLYKN